MEMENQTATIESIFQRIKSYGDTRIELLKLKAIDKSSSVLSVFITYVIVFVIFGCFFLFLNTSVFLQIFIIQNLR